MHTIELIKQRRAEWQGLQPVPPDRMEKVKRKIRLEWNYNSNAIEGNRISLGETRALILENRSPEGKSFEEIRDIKGHDLAISQVYDWWARKIQLNESYIRDLHTVLMVSEYTIETQTEAGARTLKTVRPGSYKEDPNFRLINGKTVLYTLPQEVPAQMHDLLTWYRTPLEDVDPLVAAAVFHHRFSKIHPFPDGNGRMGRLLLNFFLMERGYTPVILNVSEREPYISALRAADMDELGMSQLTRLIADAELASLDLHCRAARGEEVEEDTDIDKVILLMNAQFAQAEEPKPKTRELLLEVFDHSIAPLLTRLSRKLELFNPWFASAVTIVSVDGQKTPRVHSLQTDLRALREAIDQQRMVKSIVIHFEWRGFKKAGLKIFDHADTLHVSFQPLSWSVTAGEISKLRMYQERLGEDETRELVDAVRHGVIKVVQHRTE